jgi:[acyl-carrier-protein] S-malonyltransferase
MTIATLFPGQGSQFAGMADAWTSHPAARAVLEEVSGAVGRDIVEGCRDEGALATTAFVQPALLACDVAAFRVLEAEGVEAGAAAGHSLGEYAALVAAGVLHFDDAVRLVAERAAAMADAGDLAAGSMVAMLGGEDHAVRALAQRLGLTVANDNAPGQLVLSGAVDAIAQAEELARDEAGARARRLDVSGAFHSPLMEPAAERLRAALARVEVHRAAFPVYSNGTAARFGADPRAELSENLLRGVRWRETLLALRAAGIERFVEHGPGAVLTGLVKRTLAAV